MTRLIEATWLEVYARWHAWRHAHHDAAARRHSRALFRASAKARRMQGGT